MKKKKRDGVAIRLGCTIFSSHQKCHGTLANQRVCEIKQLNNLDDAEYVPDEIQWDKFILPVKTRTRLQRALVTKVPGPPDADGPSPKQSAPRCHHDPAWQRCATCFRHMVSLMRCRCRENISWGHTCVSRWQPIVAPAPSDFHSSIVPFKHGTQPFIHMHTWVLEGGLSS